jgi:hypothetical protein
VLLLDVASISYSRVGLLDIQHYIGVEFSINVGARGVERTVSALG